MSDASRTKPPQRPPSALEKAVSRGISRLDETTQKLKSVQLKAQHGRADTSPATDVRSGGKVRHDDRGNAVWDYAVATGIFALESTSKLLKKLEAPQLEINDDTGLKLEDGKPGGYDPYNRRR